MTNSCCVFGCHARVRKGNGISFHVIPAVIRNRGKKIEDLSQKRRREWLAKLKLKKLNDKTIKEWTKVCSKHFINGKPATLTDVQNPDWVPSLHLGYGESHKKDGQKQSSMEAARYERSIKRQNSRVTTEELGQSLLNDLGLDGDVEADIPGDDFAPIEDQTQSAETDINMERPCHLPHCPHIRSLDAEITSLREENFRLKSELHRRSFTEETFKEDKEVLYYTGLPNKICLMALFSLLAAFIPTGPRSTTTKFQSMVMLLVRLRLGLPLKILGDLFGLSESAASSLCAKMLDVMFVRLTPLILWPDREHLQATMPLDFLKAFGRKVTVIIDCFELFIETPSNLEARAQTFSSYKHHNTIKFLIGITPQGVVSYISKGWGGRTSDKHITENSSFLDKLNPGDLILADRGFNIEESVGLMCARVAIPAFTRGKKQLSPFDVESTRKLAHLRIHVERVIGNIMQKYRILDTTLPITSLVVAEDESVTALDKMVTVCCALVNMCPSVVPMD